MNYSSTACLKGYFVLFLFLFSLKRNFLLCKDKKKHYKRCESPLFKPNIFKGCKKKKKRCSYPLFYYLSSDTHNPVETAFICIANIITQLIEVILINQPYCLPPTDVVSILAFYFYCSFQQRYHVWLTISYIYTTFSFPTHNLDFSPERNRKKKRKNVIHATQPSQHKNVYLHRKKDFFF